MSPPHGTRSGSEDALQDPLQDPLQEPQALPPLPSPAEDLQVSGKPEDADAHVRWAGGLGALNALSEQMEADPLPESALLGMLEEIRGGFGFVRLQGGVDPTAQDWWLDGELNPKVKKDKKDKKSDGLKKKITRKRNNGLDLSNILSNSRDSRAKPIEPNNPYARQMQPVERKEKITSTLAENFQALHLFLDDGSDPPKVEGFSFTGAMANGGLATAVPDDKLTLVGGRTEKMSSYTVRMRAYDTGDDEGYKTYKVGITYNFLDAMGIGATLPKVISSSYQGGKGNPFGRFAEEKDVYVKVAEKRFAKNTLTDLEKTISEKYGSGRLLNSGDKVPMGYKLDHESALGFQVWVPDRSPTHGPTTLSSTQSQDLVKIATTKLTGITNEDRSSDGGSKKGDSNKQRLKKFEGRNRGLAQTTVMNGSPNDVAATLGLNKSWSWEWLHLIAHHFGGGDGKPQVASNLVLGTAEANSRMLEIEEGLATALRNGRTDKVSFDVKPTLLDSQVPWLASEIAYTVTLNGNTTTEKFYPLNQSKPPLVGLEVARSLAGKMN